MGETQGALDAMQQARRLAADLPPWIKARVAAQEALVRLAGGDLRAADRWRQESGLNADDQPTLQQRFLYRTLARVLIALGREPSNARLLEGALGLLSRLLETAEPAGAMGTVIEVLVLQAMALQAQGKVDQALPALERALSLAEPEGYVRTFIEEGAPMADLLRQTAARGITPQYVGRLLAALGGTPPASPAATLIEPLSKRELEVLRLLTTPMPHTEIAAELYVSVNTVRTHIKNIYSKLDVHSRMEAVQQAEELGLV
jgi:LuxR family maltose regulon positive regulatory protein